MNPYRYARPVQPPVPVGVYGRCVQPLCGWGPTQALPGWTPGACYVAAERPPRPPKAGAPHTFRCALCAQLRARETRSTVSAERGSGDASGIGHRDARLDQVSRACGSGAGAMPPTPLPARRGGLLPAWAGSDGRLPSGLHPTVLGPVRAQACSPWSGSPRRLLGAGPQGQRCLSQRRDGKVLRHMSQNRAYCCRCLLQPGRCVNSAPTPIKRRGA